MNTFSFFQELWATLWTPPLRASAVCLPTPSPCGPEPKPEHGGGGWGGLALPTWAPSSHACYQPGSHAGTRALPFLPQSVPWANAVGHTPSLALEEQWERAADAPLHRFVPSSPHPPTLQLSWEPAPLLSLDSWFKWRLLSELLGRSGVFFFFFLLLLL